KLIEELIDNAFKFSPPGTAVSICDRVEQNRVILTITDQGRGMTSEQIANLGAYMQFERKLYEQQGSGLGLAIAQRLAQLHGGELTLESRPGKETTVHVSLAGE
ncbi:MAG: ATP-binding protein, partial [Coleofasciculus sp. C2-GNP5-27]